MLKLYDYKKIFQVVVNRFSFIRVGKKSNQNNVYQNSLLIVSFDD